MIDEDDFTYSLPRTNNTLSVIRKKTVVGRDDRLRFVVLQLCGQNINHSLARHNKMMIEENCVDDGLRVVACWIDGCVCEHPTR